MNLYQPLYCPWFDDSGEFRKFHDAALSKSLVSMDRSYSIYCLLKQASNVDGEVWELGVYKGGTAAMMAWLLERSGPDKVLRLFDTFSGMPKSGDIDVHKEGDFSDTSTDEVRKLVAYKNLVVHKGMIEDTVPLVRNRIAFAHIDLDIYSSTKFALEAIWHQVSVGGIVVVDDYGFIQCIGARVAVDEFFADKKCVPLCLGNGQAIIFKGVP